MGVQSTPEGRRLALERRAAASQRYENLARDGKARRGVPELQSAAYLRAVDGTASARRAIAAFCHECCGYDREAVATCPARACPLWQYRPYRPTREE